MLYRAKIIAPDGSVQWLSASNISELAQKAWTCGNNTVQLPQVPTFQEYSETILNDYKQDAIKPTTMLGYRGYCKNYLYPAFGSTPLNEIKPGMIQTYLNKHKTLAAKTLKEHLNYMRQVFDYAIEEKYMSDNPAKSKILTNPSHKVTVRDTLTEDQIRDVYNNLTELDPVDACVVALYLFTGMRRGELAGLQRKDIGEDFISITKEAVYPSCNKPCIDFSGKTKSAIRLVPVLDLLRPFIIDCDPECYIYRKELEPPTLTQLHRTWERIEKKINMYGATPHIMRHTFTTICNNTRVDLKSIKLIIGHSTADITVGRYTHGMKSMLLNAGQKINDEYVALLNAEGPYAARDTLYKRCRSLLEK